MDMRPEAAGWLEFSTTVERAEADAAEGLLLEAGALSVSFRDAADDPVLEPAPGETPLWPQLVITGLFPGDTDPLALLSVLQAGDPALRWQFATLAERAWEREWLRDYRPLRFGRLAVVPTGMEAPPDAVVLRLDPGLAFGTGTHPTTALCLAWLEALAAPGADGATPLLGATVIDYGCGSGILALAALRLGAAAAIAVDLDPQALTATRANAVLNGLADRVAPCAPEALGPLLAGAKADILVANILAGPLRELLPEFAAVTAPGGQVALSGILADQAADLATAGECWFEFDDAARSEDWVRLSGRRKTRS